MACTWLGEISYCSCLTFLPGPAWVLLSKIYKPFPGSLYMLYSERQRGGIRLSQKSKLPLEGQWVERGMT